jgi:hypothetical protein
LTNIERSGLKGTNAVMQERPQIFPQAEIGDYLNLSRIGARNSILRGERILDMCDAVWGKV